MHRVEIRLTHEGDEPAANFEVYNETLKDGTYVELAPMRVVASGGAPIVLFLEGDERVIVVAKAEKGRMVYDKDQNANVRVETEAEIKDRKAREERVAKAHADREIQSAQARLTEAQESAQRAERDANASVKRAEADRASIEADQAKNRAAASKSLPAGSPTRTPPSNPSPSPARTGSPASANTGPVDSKQVKNG